MDKIRYTLRPIEEKDLRIILKWRNSDKVHSQMLTNHKISWDEHYSWFQNMKKQAVKRNFVFEYDGESIGYIGYTEYDETNHTCSPGVYLGDNVTAPKDAALYLFVASIEYAFYKLNMQKLNTDVFADNKTALILDEFLGYEIVPNKEHYVVKNGEEKLTYRLILSKEKWLKHKKILQSYICV